MPPARLDFDGLRQVGSALGELLARLSDPASESAGASTRAQGQARGAARFVRGEGAWWGNGKVYFVSTGGGDDGGGQVFAYDPSSESLTLFVECVRNPSDPALGETVWLCAGAPR